MKGVPGLRIYEILDGYEDVWLPDLWSPAYADATLSGLVEVYLVFQEARHHHYTAI